MIKVLIVDDSALMRRLLGGIFRTQDDFEVAVARDGVEALVALHEFRPDVVTMDVHMPNMGGLACLDRIMVERPSRVIMLSSLTDEGAHETFEAMQLGAVDFVAKPAGAVSLGIDELAPVLIEKVRAAAKMPLRSARRLKERVKLRTGPRSAQATPINQVRLPVPRPPAARALPADTVVLVGTSTGGPPALDALLSPLPADFPWPILIAQHMPASFTGPLARRLDRLCALRVEEVVGPEPIEPGHVYVGRGDADIIVALRKEKPIVTAAAPLADYPWHPSVDRLVSTAVRHWGAQRLVGILMTGMGNDGASAMCRLRAGGGLTIAESEATAVVWGMPGELVKAGGADIVAPLDEIAGQLMDWARGGPR